MFSSVYKDVLLFFGLVASGDILLIPAIYSIKFGVISLSKLYTFAVGASIVSDTGWYVIGRMVSKDKVQKLPVLRTRPRVAERLSKLMDSKGAYILFASKFIYGTRSVTQLLCGIHTMNYALYLAISVSGTLLWTSFLVALIFLVDAGFGQLRNTAVKVQITILIVAAVLISLHYIIKRRFKSWFGE